MWDGSEVLLGMCWGKTLKNLMGIHWELDGNTLGGKGKMKVFWHPSIQKKNSQGT
jgi:hypothetical protein